jgi:dTDP-4-amino-4,6-dideoxygalactose transaminase
LNANGVGTSIYYPNPVPLMKYYKQKYGFEEGMFPEASRISRNSIALPVGPHIDEEDMDYITDMFKKAIMENK